MGGAKRKGEGSGQASSGGALACERRHPGDFHHCPLVTGSHGQGKRDRGGLRVGAESAVRGSSGQSDCRSTINIWVPRHSSGVLEVPWFLWRGRTGTSSAVIHWHTFSISFNNQQVELKSTTGLVLLPADAAALQD